MPPCLLAIFIAACKWIVSLRSERTMSEPSTISYRFRSTEALLGKYDELARREIYFASPDELNDPLEGYADVLWHGDAILWTNLLRHYLLVLTQGVTMAALTGAAFNPAFLSAVAESTDEDLPEGPVRETYAEVCSKFFAAELPMRWIATLTERDLALSREELVGFLRLLHPLALHVVLRAFDAAGLPTPLSLIDFTSGFGAMSDQFAVWLRLYDEAPGTRVELHSIEESNFLQIELLRSLGTLANPRKKGWLFLLTDFPRTYVRGIETLLYPEWRTACFVTDPRHASMWGVYADSHKGVCLALRSRQTARDERPCVSTAVPTALMTAMAKDPFSRMSTWHSARFATPMTIHRRTSFEASEASRDPSSTVSGMATGRGRAARGFSMFSPKTILGAGAIGREAPRSCLRSCASGSMKRSTGW